MGETAFTLALACPGAMMKHEELLHNRILADTTVTPSSIAAPVATLPPVVDFIVQIFNN
jgi:hypothetical protein